MYVQFESVGFISFQTFTRHIIFSLYSSDYDMTATHVF